MDMTVVAVAQAGELMTILMRPNPSIEFTSWTPRMNKRIGAISAASDKSRPIIANLRLPTNQTAQPLTRMPATESGNPQHPYPVMTP